MLDIRTMVCVSEGTIHHWSSFTDTLHMTGDLNLSTSNTVVHVSTISCTAATHHSLHSHTCFPTRCHKCKKLNNMLQNIITSGSGGEMEKSDKLPQEEHHPWYDRKREI